MVENHTLSDCREAKTAEELRMIMVQAINALAGSAVVDLAAISIGPDDNAEGNWWYGYDHDESFRQVIQSNRVALTQMQRNYRLASWVKSPRKVYDSH